MTDWFPTHPRHRARQPAQLDPRPRPRARRSARAIGALQGFIIAYIGVPSFIVTLGGLLAFRGVVWYLSNGAAVIGLDPTFQLFGGGALGSVGGAGDLDPRRHRLSRGRRAALVQQPAPATPVRLPDATDVGGGAPRRSSAARSCSALACVRQRELLAEGPGRRSYATGPRHHRAAGRPADLDRDSLADRRSSSASRS